MKKNNLSVVTVAIAGLLIFIFGVLAGFVGGHLNEKEKSSDDFANSLQENVGDHSALEEERGMLPVFSRGATSHQENDAVVDRWVEYKDADGRFSFSYPEKFFFEKDNAGTIYITGGKLREIDVDECNAYDDRQAQVRCLDQRTGLSPNIEIRYITTNEEDVLGALWYTPERQEINMQDSFVIEDDVWLHYWVHGEYGGKREYGLLQNNGMMIVSYEYADAKGGVSFAALQSTTYLLSEEEQHELLKSILETAMLKSKA
jgi:hypothetical protein